MKQMSAWLARLHGQGTPLAGPVSALLRPFPNMSVSLRKRYPWPLARPPEAIAGLMDDGTADSPVPSGARFEDPAEIDALRAARRVSHAAEPNEASIMVTSGSNTYELFVRDELPESAVAARTAFEQLSR